MKYMLLIAGADEGWDHLDEAGAARALRPDRDVVGRAQGGR